MDVKLFTKWRLVFIGLKSFSGHLIWSCYGHTWAINCILSTDGFKEEWRNHHQPWESIAQQWRWLKTPSFIHLQCCPQFPPLTQLSSYWPNWPNNPYKPPFTHWPWWLQLSSHVVTFFILLYQLILQFFCHYEDSYQNFSSSRLELKNWSSMKRWNQKIVQLPSTSLFCTNVDTTPPACLMQIHIN